MTDFVADTSAVLAVLFDEPEAAAFLSVLIAGRPITSAATRVEMDAAALRRLGVEGPDRVEALVASLGISVVPFDAAQAALARDALARFGRGRREPPAVLNFGDAFSYALAKARGLPLLYKGADFAQTDVAAALPA